MITNDAVISATRTHCRPTVAPQWRPGTFHGEVRHHRTERDATHLRSSDHDGVLVDVLVSGASGNVGGELLAGLPGAGHGVRAPTSSSPSVPDGAVVVRGDPPSPACGLLLLSDYRDLPGILDQPARAGITRVVLLSGGSAGSGDTTNAVTAHLTRSEAGAPRTFEPWARLHATECG